MTQKFERSEVIYADPYIKFHRFSDTGKEDIVLLPPYAGRYGTCDQNKADALVRAGHRVHLVDLQPATIETGHFSILDWIGKIDMCVDFTGADTVALAGDCQGGTLAAIYTSLHQDRVNKLSVTCAPINTQTGQDNPIEQYSKNMDRDYHRLVVASHGGVQPGLMQYLAFYAANPWPMAIDRYVKTAKIIFSGDDAALEKDREINAWLDTPFSLHGGWFLPWLFGHFGDNKFYDGTWDLGGGIIPNLADITCPLFLYQGGADPVTHPQQLLDIRNKVSSSEIRWKVFEGGGHTSPFVNKDCLGYFINEFFAEEVVCAHLKN